MKYSPTLKANSVLDLETREARRFASLADSKNTQRAYTADWRHFISWCKNRNKAPLPVAPDDLAIYLRFCAEKHKLKMSTLRRRLAAIAEAHRRNGFQTPSGEWVVKNTMRRLRRDLGTPEKGKSPLLVKDIKEMISHCPPTLTGLRDKALLLIGFVGAFRRSELVALDIEDVTTSDEGIVVMIRGSKTDQKREGRKVGIPFGNDPLTCPVKSLIDWLDAANITSGPLFRSMMKEERPRTTRMSDRVVAEIVKKYCSLIGKKVAGFSGHSLRAGLATSAAIAGASEASIQKQTGHKSLIILRRYIRDASLFRENAVHKLEL